MQRMFIGSRGKPCRLVRLISVTLALLLGSPGSLADLEPLSEQRHVQSKIAIVGAGFGGAFTAYNLRKLLNDTAELHVFEGKEIGGRVQSFSYENHVYEAGASIAFAKNYYVRDAADELGLKRVPPEATSEDLFSIYNGTHFVFRQSSWTLVTLWRMVQRYWLTYFTFSAPKEMLHKFLKLYDLQKQGMTFDTPEAFLSKLQLYDLTQQSMHDYLKKSLGNSPASRRFATELVAAVNKVNYNQDSGLNAFAGMVSMLPTVNPDLFKIDEGNVQVAQKLLEYAQPELSTANVTQISKLPNGSYTIESSQGSAAQAHGPFSAVVIATPLEFSNIQFSGLELPHIPPRKFQSTISTFVRGLLNGTYFAVKQPPTGAIMISEHAGTPFSVISPAKEFPDKTQLYKLFSTEPIKEDALNDIFSQHKVVATFPWYAYPQFHPPEQYAPFRLGDGLFYSNAIENAASCMEISAISAMNSALLVQQHLNRTVAPKLQGGLTAYNTVAEL